VRFKYSAMLSKIHSYRQLFQRFFPLGFIKVSVNSIRRPLNGSFHFLKSFRLSDKLLMLCYVEYVDWVLSDWRMRLLTVLDCEGFWSVKIIRLHFCVSEKSAQKAVLLTLYSSLDGSTFATAEHNIEIGCIKSNIQTRKVYLIRHWWKKSSILILKKGAFFYYPRSISVPWNS